MASFAGLLLGGPSVGAPLTLDYQGYTYTLDSGNDISSGTAAKEILNTSWYGDPVLTKGLAKTVELSLGSNFVPGGFSNTQLAPYFYYYFEPGSASNIDSNKFASECQFRQENYSSLTLKETTCIDRINRFDIAGEYRYGYAYEASPRIPIAPPASITTTGNLIGGSGINITSNLPSQGGTKLLPQFQGGTLTVSLPSLVTDNFTLSSSSSNTIDVAGNSATFSGIFSDENGAKGSIAFSNTSSKQATLTLTGQSIYSGRTWVKDNTTLQINAKDALPTSTVLLISGGGKVALSGNDQTVGMLSGSGQVDVGKGTLTVDSSGISGLSGASVSGDGNLIKSGSYTQLLSGKVDLNGILKVKEGTLILSGSSSSNTTIESGATLAGTGTVSADILNSGVLAPGGDPRAGQSIGTLTINKGIYKQTSNGVLALEVDGTTSDLLKLTGSALVDDLAGTVKISGTPTSGLVYTGIAGTTPYSGKSTANADTSSVVIAASYQFCREDDPCFKNLQGAPSVDRTKLQFGWAALDVQGTPVPIKDTTPEQAITYSKQKGGPITKTITSSTDVLKTTCIANTSDPNGCNAALNNNDKTPPISGNIVVVAKPLDGGNSAIAAVVNTGVTGGTPIPTATGGSTGYTTNQAQAAGLPADFVTVLNAVNNLPTRSAVISSLHQVTAEPYASMQSVALEAMEQFRANTLALTSGTKAIPFIAEEEVCTVDSNVKPGADDSQKPKADCKPRTIKKLTPWSLLIDGSNTQASLNGTNDLASLDYNIFSSSYGLQYDFNRNWSAGAAFGYGRANLYNYEYANVNIDSSTYSGAAWGIYRPSEAWKFTALAGYMNLQYSSNRNISFGGLNRTANANWSGNGFTAALAAEYDWVLSSDKTSRSAVRIKPNTFFSYALHNQGAFSETGADSLNLALNSHTADSLIYGIGFQIETPIVTGKTSRLIPRLSLGYQYDFNGNSNEEHQLTASFAEVPALGSVDVLGQNRGANAVDVGLLLEYETSQTISLYAGVGGAFWNNGNQISYGGGLKFRW